MLCAAVATNCAPAVAPASRAAALASGQVVLDEQGLRDLLAGVELELGDARAETARETAAREDIERRLKTALQQNESLVWRATWGPLLGAGGGAIAAAVICSVIFALLGR